MVTEVLSSWEPEAWLESSPLSRATAIVAGAGWRR